MTQKVGFILIDLNSNLSNHTFKLVSFLIVIIGIIIVIIYQWRIPSIQALSAFAATKEMGMDFLGWTLKLCDFKETARAELYLCQSLSLSLFLSRSLNEKLKWWIFWMFWFIETMNFVNECGFCVKNSVEDVLWLRRFLKTELGQPITVVFLGYKVINEKSFLLLLLS